jgi:protein TonB
MGKPAEHILTPQAPKRVLLIAQDPWLRFRLERELKQAGSEVAVLGCLRPEDVARERLPDVVLVDATLLPEGSRLEALRALRAGSPQARFVLLVSPAEEAIVQEARASGFDLVLERPLRAEALSEVVAKALGEFLPRAEAIPVPVHFELLLERGGGLSKRRAGTAFTSLVIHSLVLIAVLFVPLIYTETIDIQQLAQTWLVAPPPPPPPPPPAPASALVRRVKPVFQTLEGRLVAPKAIPKEIPQIVDSDVKLESYGVPGGVPGGVLGGTLGGVIGGIVSSTTRPLLPPPPVPQKPIRVGGRIRPPRLIQRVEPDYPTIARQARIQGEVRIDAVIDSSGRVTEMKVLSGHPLLVQAALNAVQRWVYEPTYLNEQPIAVLLEVTVFFRLQ